MLDRAGPFEPSAAGRAAARPGEAPRLALSGLVYERDGERLIDGVDLALDHPGVTMLMGPTGAGKSLLLRLMHGLASPTEGVVRWDGRPMSETARRRQAMVFQRPVLLRRSVAANVDFALKLRGPASRERRDALLEMVGLADRARAPARRLSGGEAQRLALARALATEPDTLFLDEPTASLDPASVLSIERVVLDAVGSGVKAVFVSHDVGQARRMADDVVFLHRGKVVEHSRADRFFESPTSAQARDYLAGRLVL